MQKHERINKNGLWIEEPLHDFLEMEVLPGSMVNPELFWKGFSNLIKNYSPLNKQLLKKRDYLQKEINAWHQNQIGKKINPQVYKSFLLEIGYLMSEGDDFQIETKDIDPEIGIMSGPQLVVPVTNARYTINAVNARWGSLYDAIYGSDVLDDGPVSSSYDPERGERVIAFSKSHLDQFAPLINYSWSEVSKIAVTNNSLSLFSGKTTISLLEQSQFLGYRNDQNGILSEVILTKNDLRCRIIIDRNSNIGKDDKANINDIQIEAAITTIIDCEDSVATVDTEDKVKAYRN
jgi:malate synthase